MSFTCYYNTDKLTEQEATIVILDRFSKENNIDTDETIEWFQNEGFTYKDLTEFDWNEMKCSAVDREKTSYILDCSENEGVRFYTGETTSQDLEFTT